MQATVPIPAAPARWTRALAAFRRAEARLAGLAPGATDDTFDNLECARLDALRRLLRAPAPDLPALARKIELTIDDQAWELTDSETCLAALKAEARRLACEG